MLKLFYIHYNQTFGLGTHHTCTSRVKLSKLNLLSSRIAAVATSATSDLKGFKAHTVFKEIEKKLQEVIHLECNLIISSIIPCTSDSASLA